MALGIEILASAHYLPGTPITTAQLLKRMGVEASSATRKSGVATRHFAEHETIADMAAKATFAAVEKSSIGWQDIDLLIAAGGTPDQPIPHNSALIHHALELPTHVTPLDVNATCLSFVQALNIAQHGLRHGAYRNIVIVSSEKPSVGLHKNHPETLTLLGDGAVAFVLGPCERQAGVLFAEFATYSEGAHWTEIPAGGTRQHPKNLQETNDERFFFNMEGRKIYKLAATFLPQFYQRVLKQHGWTCDDFKQVIPHQASLLALNLMRGHLDIPDDKFFIQIQSVGNLVGASIPMALHELRDSSRIGCGDRVLLLGTAAGLTLAAMGLML